MRTCGSCSACCRWPAVPEIGKPARVPCPNLKKCGYGCTIYEDRPETCAEYRCSWLRGLGKHKDQPDKSGVLIDRRMTRFGHVLVAKGLRPGALKGVRGKNAIRRAAKQAKTLCLITNDDNLIIGAAGPKKLVSWCQGEIDERPLPLGGLNDYVALVVARAGRGEWPAM